MKINLQIIKEELPSWNFSSSYKDKAHIMRCSYSQICQSVPTQLKEEIVYIMRPDIFPALAILEPECSYSFVCLGIPDQKYLSGNCNILYSDTSESFIALQNQIQEIFFRYNQWEQNMRDGLTAKMPIQKIIEYARPFCPNPIFGQGAGFRAIFHVGPRASEITSPYYQEYLHDYGSCETGAFIPPEEINTLIADTDYSSRMNDLEPFIYPGGPYGFRTLCSNAAVGKNIIARLCINEILSPLTDRDFAVIQILSDFLAKNMTYLDIYNYNRPKDLDEILDNLLGHHFLQEKKILSVLQSYSWNMEDTYMCFCLQVKSENDTRDVLYSLAMQLSHYFCSDCYTIYEGQIVFIVNLTAIKLEQDALMRNMLPVLRDNLLTAGISTEFHDFKQLYYYFKQASIAIHYGQKKNPHFWYFRFETYNLDYLIEKCKEHMIPSALIPEGLKKLIAYDQENGSDYVNSLKIYLKNDRNIADTVRELYVHRNTFIYRLDRIQTISQLDLDDYSTRLFLMLSFAMLDN